MDGGEGDDEGVEEPSINPDDPGGGVSDDHLTNSCYDSTPCHIPVNISLFSGT